MSDDIKRLRESLRDLRQLVLEQAIALREYESTITELWDMINLDSAHRPANFNYLVFQDGDHWDLMDLTDRGACLQNPPCGGCDSCRCTQYTYAGVFDDPDVKVWHFNTELVAKLFIRAHQAQQLSGSCPEESPSS